MGYRRGLLLNGRHLRIPPYNGFGEMCPRSLGFSIARTDRLSATTIRLGAPPALAPDLPGTLAKKVMLDFRRTAVRNLERAGVPRSAAMATTGHLTAAVYARYAIVDQGMRARPGPSSKRIMRRRTSASNGARRDRATC